eukprot:CAMPEP_0118658778 /NCGR_PEP_ID=MMETSP0785-20121206/14752_1 /TAXON_ID=91992 /ORGANISM="Bolidomonas pacifica, Strain CCMP 1866" /LENGTH=71 /DNA_ID=CAMNT_0006551823 /DNA_START=164 /DNA_END=376 /DNA_ORIENTATION=-
MKSFLDLVISAKNVRQLSSALSSLSKVGKELLITSDKEGLCLSVLSDSKSSYTTVRFRRGFFAKCNPAMNG